MFEAFGSDLQKGTGTDFTTSTTWTSVGCVTNITPPSQSTSAIEVPLCLNATSRTKNVLPGSNSPGTVTYTAIYAVGDWATAKTAQGVQGCWRIKLGTSGKGIGFNGYISEVGMPELNEEGFISVNITIQVSGDAGEVVVASS